MMNVVLIVLAIGAIATVLAAVAWMRNAVRDNPIDEDDVPASRIARESVRCAPERIRPAAAKKGACGVSGCPIRQPHSHVMDLARRMKE